jgi:hypothetical protein
LTKDQKELTLEEQIQILKGKRKFYKNLIKGDTADFKAIALRIGLDFKKSKPKPKSKVFQEFLKPLQAQRKTSH